MSEPVSVTAARAAAVSRHLRVLGYRTLASGTPLSQEGVRVQRSILGQVCISVDHNLPGAATRLANSIARDVRAAGRYEVEHADGDTLIYLSSKS